MLLSTELGFKHIVLAFVALFFLPVYAHAEYIESFTTVIDIKRDGSFEVSEVIDYRFSEERHGIYREIPLTHPEKATAFFKERYVRIDLKAVEMDGKPVPYTLESDKDQFRVRIGDPNSTLSGGHVYLLNYTVEGGLSYPKGLGAELYWNVTGNDWDVPIRVVESTITSSDAVLRSVRSCYRGTFGSTSGSCHTSTRENGDVVFRTTELLAGEGMTVAQSVDITKITPQVLERTNMLWFLLPLLVILGVYGVFRIYRYKTAHQTGNTIIAQYEPYDGVKPMYAGLLMDGSLDPRDITACIVYLAEQGYLKIRRTERKVLFLFEVDDFEMELTKVPGDEVGKFERRVIELLFSSGAVVGARVSLYDLKRNENERQENHREYLSLQSDLREDLRSSGFYEHLGIQKVFTLAGGIFSVFVLGALFLTTVMKNSGILIQLLTGGLILCGLVVTILYRRRSKKGYEALDHLEGFKLFLEVTDRDRFIFHNAPEKSPEQFMKYLPYAIAFGVEKQWAKVFDGMTIPPPAWYDGAGATTFSSTNLSSSLGAFSSALKASTGASASAGNGSSGGGAGGGGGGSW